MNVLDAELAIDRLAARIAVELPAHVVAAADAYARGAATVPPPAITIAEQRAVVAALAHAELRARATRLARVVVPMAIESAPAVMAAAATARTWASWRALGAARDAEARARFGTSHRALVHALAAIASAPSSTTASPISSLEALREPVAGWRTDDAQPAIDDAIQALWRALCGGTAFGALAIRRATEPARDAPPRTFVVEPGARAILVVPARIASPAARFAVLHELGHALLWLAPCSRTLEWPRALDEAAAAYVARAMEGGGPAAVVSTAWRTSLASAARVRRLAIARALDALEHTLDIGGHDEPPDGAAWTPPWALWHDPHAQAAYVAAEAIADALPAGLAGAALAEHLARELTAIDAAGLPMR